jgi:methyltransferase
MSWAAVILALVTAQRLGELVLARRNTKRLLARGGREVGAAHYLLIVVLHAAWLLGLWYFAVLGAQAGQEVNLAWLGVFVVLQLGRVWVIASLGSRWTTRIVVLPGEPLVRRGPYRFVSHPNYWVVAGEIIVLPLAFGLTAFGLVFTVLNAAMMWIRIRAEAAALAPQ